MTDTERSFEDVGTTVMSYVVEERDDGYLIEFYGLHGSDGQETSHVERRYHCTSDETDALVDQIYREVSYDVGHPSTALAVVSRERAYEILDDIGATLVVGDLE